MRRLSIITVVLFGISLGLLQCGGSQKKEEEQAGLVETGLRTGVEDGILQKTAATIRGDSYEVYIQKANTKVYHELDIPTRGAAYMKICGLPAEAGEAGAVKFDVIADEGGDSPFTIFGGYVSPFASLNDITNHINVTVDVSKLAGELVEVTIRLVGDEGATLAWTEPTFRPFPGAKEK